MPNDFGFPALDADGNVRPVHFSVTGIPTFGAGDSEAGQPDQSRYGNPFLYTGRQWDAELGMYHYRMRHMDPLAGRFTTVDPLGPWGDPLNLGNGYTYVGNNPWTYTDPFGLAGESEVALTWGGRLYGRPVGWPWW